MASKRKKNRFFTVLFVPEDSGRTLSMHVRREILHSLVVFIVLFMVGIATLIYFAGDIAAKLQLVYSLQQENTHLRHENEQLLGICSKVDKIQLMNGYLRHLALAADERKPPAQSAASAVAAHQEKSPEIFDKDNLDNQLDTMRLVHGAGEKTSKRAAVDGTFDAMPYIRPVEGWVTRRFAGGENGHAGIDFAAPLGALIRATAPGVVRSIDNDLALGKVVLLQHAGGIATRYGHCSQVLVQPGDHVTRGQTIALVGNTGRSSAPHLHYEVIKDGRQVDPLWYVLDNEE
jgi:murein DD-endopeptidase MepM/ murein hydrolase activator NlpD